jgi:outer membrane protein assembly factor BamB
MGNPQTGEPRRDQASAEDGYLVCIDLESEGRLLWKVLPPGGPWAFEGSPLSDGRNVYVALRRSDVRPQAHVACYDAQTGRPRWRRFICAAETPGQNTYPEITHNLLTLDHGTLYYNTNLGAVAALSAEEGLLRWVSLYPRRRQGDRLRLAPHWGRSLNPCVYWAGTVLVAPADSRRIFALDALTGQILWQTGSQVEDVVHLLGVADDQLIASGRRLYWIGLDHDRQGRIRHVWPPTRSLQPQGRGILADGWVYLPADDRVYVFDQRSAELKRIIELRPKGVAVGNLLVADGRLLIATDHELVAIGRSATRGPSPHERGPNLTMTSSRGWLGLERSEAPVIGSLGHPGAPEPQPPAEESAVPARRERLTLNPQIPKSPNP